MNAAVPTLCPAPESAAEIARLYRHWAEVDQSARARA